MLACTGGHTHLVDVLLSSARSSSRGEASTASEVLLHVYELGHNSHKCDLISLLHALGTLFGGRRRTSCGVYHTVGHAPRTRALLRSVLGSEAPPRCIRGAAGDRD